MPYSWTLRRASGIRCSACHRLAGGAFFLFHICADDGIACDSRRHCMPLPLAYDDSALMVVCHASYHCMLSFISSYAVTPVTACGFACTTGSRFLRRRSCRSDKLHGLVGMSLAFCCIRCLKHLYTSVESRASQAIGYVVILSHIMAYVDYFRGSVIKYCKKNGAR